MAKKSTSVSNKELTRASQKSARTAVDPFIGKRSQVADDGIFQSFIENLPVMFYAVEPTPPHTPIYISPTFEAFGYPLNDWMTDSEIWDRIIHPEDRKIVLDGTRLAMKRGESIDFEYRVISSDGRVLWVRDRSCFIKDNDGRLLCWQGVIFDITERKLAEQELQKREKMYRTLARTLPRTAVLLFDNEFRYTLADGEQLKRHNWSQEMFENKTLWEVFPPEISDEWSDYYQRALNGETIAFEMDNDEGAFQISVLPVRDEDNEIFAGMVMWHDITERKAADNALKVSESRYRQLFENANDIIYVHDLKGNYISINQAAEKIFGYTREEALKLNMKEIIVPEHLKLVREQLSKKINGTAGQTVYEIDCITKGGERISLEVNSSVITKDGLPIAVQGIARDITERQQAEASLRNALSLFESTFESTADGIVVMSLDRNKIVTCNKKFVEMWNVDNDVVVSKDGKKLVEFVSAQLKNTDDFVQKLDETYVDPLATVTEILELKDGRIIERCSQPQLLEGNPIGRVACFRDITERNLAEEKLRYYALHDTLTDLPNRVQFMNHLRLAVERAEGNNYAKFAVLFLDLDRFKVINDSLGHAVGDKLLVAIAERLTACVRPGDVVARLGGDEFVILLNRSGDTPEVVNVAERLQAKISEPFKIDNYEVFTTASIGIIVSGSMSRKAEDFLRDADAAMYRAKESGKARYEIFDRKMHVQNMNLLQVETDLRHAVERSEFEVLYQPIVDLATGHAHEFEALIRWRHPVHGLVMPNEFVNVAEETGLIIQIGKWILDESCRQIAEWQHRFNLPLSISVNLSAKQLMHPTLSAQLKQVLSETGLDSNQLKLEVTESTVMEHSEKSLKILSELDQLGVSLSTDDFGTGYSSLSYLQRFPFDRLKIDRSFINIMHENEKSRSIVKTILMLGENLDIEVVAEGIETAEHLEKLRSLGCTKGQGYLFSRPIDREAAEDFLASGANVFANLPNLEFRNPGPIIEVSDVQ